MYRSLPFNRSFELLIVALLLIIVSFSGQVTASPEKFHDLKPGDTWTVPQNWACAGDLMFKNEDGTFTNGHDIGTATSIVVFTKSTMVVAPYGGSCADVSPSEMMKRHNKQNYFVFFPQTGHSIKGRFWDKYNDEGLMRLGYPISEEEQRKSPDDGKVYTVQYFERTMLEFHPENKAPYDVLIPLLGKEQYKRDHQGQQTAGGAPANPPASPCNNMEIKGNWTFLLAQCQNSVFVVGDITYNGKGMWEGRQHDNDATLSFIYKDGATVAAEWGARVYTNTPENVQMVTDQIKSEGRQVHWADEIK